MKNLFISFSFLFLSACAFGQSVLIEPATASKRFIVKSTGTVYGHFSTSNSAGADLFFKTLATGDGYSGTDIGTISTFNDRIYLGGSINNQLSLGANGQERMRFALDGKVGIGTFSPNYNLQLHNPNTGTSSILQLTNETIGSTTTDGLYIGVNNFGNASIFNQESGSLRIGTNGSGFLALLNEKACLSCLIPAGKFDIYHNTGNANTNPHITLRTTTDASNGIIRMENNAGSRFFGQYFSVGSATPANNFLSFDYNGTQPILDLAGNGNVQVAGFTKLGGATAPSIKMITLTSTTSNSVGGNVFFPHSLTVAKVLDYEVLVDTGGGVWVKENHTTVAGRQFDTEINSVNVRVYNHATNSGSILSKPLKVLITYTE